uniref:Uncharacterized protein n=1 Tax=Anguilla anguilla TaxID=7936 RepID=A0A0E9WW75_ANGAN
MVITGLITCFIVKCYYAAAISDSAFITSQNAFTSKPSHVLILLLLIFCFFTFFSVKCCRFSNMQHKCKK